MEATTKQPTKLNTVISYGLLAITLSCLITVFILLLLGEYVTGRYFLYGFTFTLLIGTIHYNYKINK